MTRPSFITFGDYVRRVTERESFLAFHEAAHEALFPQAWAPLDRARGAPRELGELDRKHHRQTAAGRYAQPYVNTLARLLPDNAPLADRICRCARRGIPELLDTMVGAEYRVDPLPGNAFEVIDAVLFDEPVTAEEKAAQRQTLRRARIALGASHAVGWRVEPTGPAGPYSHLSATGAEGPRTVVVASQLGYPRGGVVLSNGGDYLLLPDGIKPGIVPPEPFGLHVHPKVAE